MVIRIHFIISVTIVCLFCSTAAIVHRSPTFKYDQNIQPPHSRTRQRLPGETLGRIIGNFIVNAANSDYNLPIENGEPRLEDQYGRDIYNTDDSSRDFDYDNHYNSEEYHNDDRYSTAKEIPISRIRSGSPNRVYETDMSLDSRYGDRKEIVDDKITNGYQDSAFDPNLSDINRFPTSPGLFNNPNTVNEGLRSDKVPQNDKNVSQGSRTSLQETEDTYRRKPNNNVNLPGIDNRYFDDSEDKTFKVLTLRKFMFQAQPVRPKTKTTEERITIYYLT